MARSILSHMFDIKKTALELFDIWKHLGADECYEQVEAHLESSGFSGHDIVIVMDEMRDMFDHLEYIGFAKNNNPDLALQTAHIN